MKHMNDGSMPIARTEGLVVQELEQETLIYDLRRDKAFCLNRTSSMVWHACDGKNSLADIVGLIGDENVVFLALDQLGREDLLEQKQKDPYLSWKLPRREVIKRIGLTTAIALPAVMSLVAPQASMAASLLGTGAACANDAQCQSNRCRNPGCNPTGTSKTCQPPGVCP